VAAAGATVTAIIPGDSDYLTYACPPTRGTVTPLINGRNSNGSGGDIDRTEPLDVMQTAVQTLTKGDAVYVAAWFFEPATRLTRGPYVSPAGVGTAATWGSLLATKAHEGVVVRLLINDFDPISGMDRWLMADGLVPLDTLIRGLPVEMRDNFKYLVCRHPAHVGAAKSWLAGQGAREIYVASHHEKFMVVRRGKNLTAFCGGLDIESRKTPLNWSYGGLVAWHDIHVRLEGPITRDLEREFVMRWNRDRGASRRLPVAGWKGYERLCLTPLSADDDSPAKKLHDVQMLRTVSHDGMTSPYSTDRRDIIDAYVKAISGATSFIYMENQYFRSDELAEAVAARAKAVPTLVVIMVVVANAGADDGANAITAHGDYLQFDAFDTIARAMQPSRFRVYTMFGRAVHSKFISIDDRWMCVGSANANVRSFEMDTELNIQTSAPPLVGPFRQRLWAHNLGVGETAVGSWMPRDFVKHWDAVARHNAAVSAARDMLGEGIVAFDYRSNPGQKHVSIPDGLARLDWGPDSLSSPGSARRPAQKVAVHATVAASGARSNEVA
jgi:phosphatidylserine/phosphatidylglycerophosphate/cardiolipin synthase-like enzyme